MVTYMHMNTHRYAHTYTLTLIHAYISIDVFLLIIFLGQPLNFLFYKLLSVLLSELQMYHCLIMTF